MRLISKNAARAIYGTLDSSEKKVIFDALNNDNDNRREVTFSEFYEYLDGIIQSNVEYDTGLCLDKEV